MAGLGFFADDVVDRANLPETPAAVPRYEDEAGPEPVPGPPPTAPPPLPPASPRGPLGTSSVCPR